MGVSARARELFLMELARRGVAPRELEGGAFELQLGETTVTVNLDNKAREFDETGDEDVITKSERRSLSH